MKKLTAAGVCKSIALVRRGAQVGRFALLQRCTVYADAKLIVEHANGVVRLLAQTVCDDFSVPFVCMDMNLI
jgi:hypothetical protein